MQNYIYKYKTGNNGQGIFPEEYAKCLVPIKITDDREYDSTNDPIKFYGAFLFAENVKYYSGNLYEMVDFAEKYGTLQVAINNYRDDIQFGKELPYVVESNYKEELDRYYIRVKECYEKGRRNDSLAALMENYSLSNKVCEEIELDSKNRVPKDVPYLLDTHPHNTFFKGQKCVLIYDYEAISKKWTHAEVVSFTLHRFTREHFRQLYKEEQSLNKSLINDVVNKFIKGYSKYGPKLPNDFKEKLSKNIKYTNFCKVIAYFRLVSQNHEWYKKMAPEEIRKFIIFLKEAKYYEF